MSGKTGHHDMAVMQTHGGRPGPCSPSGQMSQDRFPAPLSGISPEGHDTSSLLSQQASRQFPTAISESHSRPPPYQPMSSRNMLPVVIPQVTTHWKGAFHCPFTRAWCPGLLMQGVSQAEWLTFIDGFNEAFVASPAFAAVDMAGAVMGQMWGMQTVQLVGGALQLASGLGSAGVSYIRARMFIKAANKELFNPKGLHVTVLTTKKLTEKIGFPDEKVKLLPRHQEEADESEDFAQLVSEGKRIIQRRLQALDGYVQPLDFNIPPSVASSNLLKRMGEWQAKRLAQKQEKKLEKRERKADKRSRKKERKADKRHHKYEDKLDDLEWELQQCQSFLDSQNGDSTAQPPSEMRKDMERKYRKRARELQEKIEKVKEKRRRKLEKDSDSSDSSVDKAQRKEQKAVNKVRWIVVTGLGSDNPPDSPDRSDDSDDSDESDYS